MLLPCWERECRQARGDWGALLERSGWQRQDVLSGLGLLETCWSEVWLLRPGTAPSLKSPCPLCMKVSSQGSLMSGAWAQGLTLHQPWGYPHLPHPLMPLGGAGAWPGLAMFWVPPIHPMVCPQAGAVGTCSHLLCCRVEAEPGCAVL